MNHRGAWLVWGTGVFAYLVAVTQRTAFGVAGVEATERFSATASVLSVFTVVQLLVYAGLQIPVGMLVDRFGPRLLITAGAVLMFAGQFQLAMAESVGAGIVGRSLVGAGDALTFISVLRLLPAWFAPQRIPVLTQWTGIIGQLGQIASAIPFAFVLHELGWNTAFIGAASLSILAFVLALALIRNQPGGVPRPTRSVHDGGSLSAAWRQPGTRLGLWTHFTIQFPGTVFVLMWGYPYLVSGEQVSPAAASLLMTFFVVIAILCGPWLGSWVGRHPLRRSTMVLLIAGAMAGAWLIVMLWPGPAPLWVLLGLVAVLAVGGPGSMIGFDFARTYNPSTRLGTATGIVNIGGFVASLVSMYLVGLVLDILLNTGFSGGNLYDLAAFRIALAVQFLVMGLGVLGILRNRRKIRAALADEGLRLPSLREALARDRRRRREERSGGQAGGAPGGEAAPDTGSADGGAPGGEAAPDTGSAYGGAPGGEAAPEATAGDAGTGSGSSGEAGTESGTGSTRR